MSILSELVSLPGVMAAGEYAYRGDRFSYEGELDDEVARSASIMCRATTMALHMQTDMMKSLNSDCGCAPAQGWIVNGDQVSVCVYGNVFCFVDNNANALNSVMQALRDKVGEQTGELV